MSFEYKGQGTLVLSSKEVVQLKASLTDPNVQARLAGYLAMEQTRDQFGEDGSDCSYYSAGRSAVHSLMCIQTIIASEKIWPDDVGSPEAYASALTDMVLEGYIDG